jgi:hypothetical protein
VSAIALLMGLLFLSYLGSLIVAGRGTGTSRGLPTGIEYHGLGFVVGPSALGLVERPMIGEFEPIVQVALGWLAFVVGLDFGRVNGRRVRAKEMVLGVFCALLTGGLVAFAVTRGLRAFPVPGITGVKALVFAGGAGAVVAETTRNAVQWVAQRWSAKGPVTDVLLQAAAADDFAPLVAAGAIFAFVPAGGLTVTLPAAGWLAASLALGALLGTVTALLLRAAEGYAVWGALIGTLLLGVGTASRFGFCTIFVTFVMGIALASVSGSRRVLRRMVGETERAVLFPMLLLAGARLDPRPLFDSRALVAIVALVLLARIAGKLVSGLVIRAVVPASRPAGPLLGVVLLSSGPVSISIGFVFALRFPGPVGDTLLVCAVASAIVGELVSTLALKRLLTALGEIVPGAEPSKPEPPRPSVPEDAPAAGGAAS